MQYQACTFYKPTRAKGGYYGSNYICTYILSLYDMPKMAYADA